jgi:hypothetical protein
MLSLFNLFKYFSFIDRFVKGTATDPVSEPLKRYSNSRSNMQMSSALLVVSYSELVCVQEAAGNLFRKMYLCLTVIVNHANLVIAFLLYFYIKCYTLCVKYVTVEASKIK